MMDSSKQARGSITNFFLLTFLISVPFYVLNLLAYRNVVGNPEMGSLYIALLTVTPVASASLLTFKNRGRQGIKELFGRAVDFRRITRGRWYVASLLTAPLLYMIPIGVLVHSNISMPPSLTPVAAFPIMFLFFLLLAAGEEIGWMGYAFQPMLSRFGALKASLILGMIWALWHVPFFILMMPDPVVFGAQIFMLMGTRVLMAWIFNNTGKSVFAVIMFHAADNAALVAMPDIHADIPWGVVLHCGTVMIAAMLVTFLWGHETLARFRFGDRKQN